MHTGPADNILLRFPLIHPPPYGCWTWFCHLVTKRCCILYIFSVLTAPAAAGSAGGCFYHCLMCPPTEGTVWYHDKQCNWLCLPSSLLRWCLGAKLWGLKGGLHFHIDPHSLDPLDPLWLIESRSRAEPRWRMCTRCSFKRESWRQKIDSHRGTEAVQEVLPELSWLLASTQRYFTMKVRVTRYMGALWCFPFACLTRKGN